MQIVIYSSKHRELIDFPEFSIEEEALIWNEIARGSQLGNGDWGAGDIQLVNTATTKDCFRRIGEKYLPRTKKMNRLIHFLDDDKKVDANAFFYLFNTRSAEIYRKMAAIEVLKVGNSNEMLWKQVHNRVFHVWSLLSFQFDIYAYGVDGVKEIIGEPDKEKRICRFCRKPGKPYAHISHAVPEAIGNKLLICAEECDECNEELKEVEDNFTHLMDFRRAMYGISGKERTASPKIKGRNYTIAPDAEGSPILFIKQSTEPVNVLPDGRKTFKFNHSTPVVDQDIYRALVKMVIDLVPNERLPHFQKTIDWVKKINPGVIPDALPSVYYGELPMGNMFKQPILYLFFRKGDDMTVPYCTAILFTTDVAYQFVVPYVDIDSEKFKYDDEVSDLRSKLWTYFKIKWIGQQYFSWWQSYVWNYWPLDPNAENICFRPDDDSIFMAEKRYTREELRLMDENIFSTSDIVDFRVSNFEANPVVEALKCRRNIHEAIRADYPCKILFRLFLDTNKCEFSYSIPFEAEGKQVYISATFEADIKRLGRINSRNKYITGDTFSSLAEALWKKSARIADRRLSTALRQRDINFMRQLLGEQIVEIADFEFIMDGNKVIKTNFTSLVK